MFVCSATPGDNKRVKWKSIIHAFCLWAFLDSHSCLGGFLFYPSEITQKYSEDRIVQILQRMLDRIFRILKDLSSADITLKKIIFFLNRTFNSFGHFVCGVLSQRFLCINIEYIYYLRKSAPRGFGYHIGTNPLLTHLTHQGEPMG